MTEFSVRKHHRGWPALLPVALLGLLLAQIVLLPAHGTANHDALMRTSDAPAVEHSAHLAAPGHHSGHGTGDHDHGPDGGEPACHPAPHVADAVSNRLPSNDGALAAGVLLALLAGALLAPPLRPAPGGRWWCSRPSWRPAGADLLTRVCIARV